MNNPRTDDDIHMTWLRTFHGPDGLCADDPCHIRWLIERMDAQPAPDPLRDGTDTACSLEGVHAHSFRGPHYFREWEPGTKPAPDPLGWFTPGEYDIFTNLRNSQPAPDPLRDHEWCVPHDHVEPDQARWERDQAASLAQPAPDPLREAAQAAAIALQDGLAIFADGDGHDVEHVDGQWRCFPECPAHGWIADTSVALDALRAALAAPARPDVEAEA